MTLITPRLTLLPAQFPILNAAVRKDWAALSNLLGGVDFAEHWNHFPEALAWMRDHLRDHPEEIQWWSYFIIHQPDARLIGTCGYKGYPDPDGWVEIGYEIADAYQGQGLATEAAGALVRNAWTQNGVRGVRAHTLAEDNASGSVLRKVGFVFAGEKIDLEDGRIWEYCLERPSDQ